MKRNARPLPQEGGPLLSTVFTVALLAAVSVCFKSTAADKNGVSPNSISIPKGPGSIEGLGESFQPTLNTGTAKYGIGLKVPPGTAGQMPALSLSYEGGGGNGPLGYGWSLSLPCIQRRTDKGIPTYGQDVGFSRTDVFINESKEELVPQSDGSYFCKNEGAFIRYKQGAEHWEGTLPDGTKLEFGLTASGRIENAGRVFCWLLERETDTRGNVIEYVHRSFPGAENLNQKYLALVRYGPGAPPWSNFHLVKLEYEDRPDWFEDGRAGFLVRTGKRLKSIVAGTQGPSLSGHLQLDSDGDGIADFLNRRYNLEYLAYAGTNSHWSLLAKVIPVGADGVSTLPGSTFAYAVCDPPGELSAANRIIGGTNEPPIVMDNELVEFVDLNGDGLPDLLKTDLNGGAHQAFLNLGEVPLAFGRAIAWDSPTDVDRGGGEAWNYNLSLATTHLADMDGDGLADLVHKSPLNDVIYFRNRGRIGWEGRQTMSLQGSPPPAPFGEPGVRTADMDFDKRMDIVQSIAVGTGVAYRIWFNLGSQTYSAPITVDQDAGLSLSDPAVHIADFNGDRVPDVARVQPDGVVVTAGLGYGRFATAIAAPLPDYTLDDAQVARARLNDMNGDGLADLVLERAAPGECWYWLNLGNYAFSPRKRITGLPTGIGFGAVIRWADINGNGTTDLVYADHDSSPRIQAVDLGELLDCGATPNLLTKIENGIGRVTRIGYAPSTRFALEDAASGQPWPDPLPFPVTVVAGVTVSDSLGHDYVTTFRYRNGYYDPIERQFRGFAEVEQIDVGDASAPTLVTRSRFDTGRDFEAMKGRLLGLSTETEDGRVFSDEVTTWISPPRTLMVGTNGEAVRYVHPIASARQVLELGRGTPRRVETELEFDTYGNQTRAINYGIVEGANRAAFNDERVTITEYALNPSAWIIRLPKRQEVTDENGVVIARTESFYDDEMFTGTNFGSVTIGNLTLRRDWITPSNATAFVKAARTKYDNYGNPIALFDPLSDGTGDTNQGHFRQLTYDDRFHSYPVRETIHVGNGKPALVFQASYDEGLATVISTRDFNGHGTTYGYDALGRLINLVKPGDTLAYPTVEYDYALAVPVGGTGVVNYVETRLLDQSEIRNPKSEMYLISRQFVDGLGRALMTKSEAESAPGSAAPRVAVNGAIQFNARQKSFGTLNSFFTLKTGSLNELLVFENIEAPGWRGQFHENGVLVTLDLASAHKSVSEYDAILRVIRVTNPDGTSGRTDYEPLVTRLLDENDSDPASPHANTPTLQHSDGLGRLVGVDEVVRLNDDGTPAASLNTWTTSYEYDLNDALVRITDSQNNRKVMQYDGLKRKTFVDDLDGGISTNHYDDASNLIETMDARGQRINYTYDGVNRLLTEEYHDENSTEFSYHRSPDVAYFYDEPATSVDHGDGTRAAADNTKGLLAYVDDASGQEHTSFDARGRVGWTVKRIRDPALPSTLVSYTTRFEYDSLDRLTRLIYPDNDQVAYEYNARNLPERIVGGPSGSIVREISYLPSAQQSRIDCGNGVRTTYKYDSRLRLTSLLTQHASRITEPLISFAYTFDGASNVKAIEDQRPESVVAAGDRRRNTQTFIYDDRYRLTRVQYNLPAPAAANGGEINYRYDRIGNLLSQTSDIAHSEKGLSLTDLGAMSYGGASGSTNRTGRQPGDAPGPHALTRIANSQSPIANRDYPYDANGNMTDIDGLRCTWDFKDRLVGVEDDTMRAEYRYDFTDRRITRRVVPKQPTTDNGPRTTLYIGKHFEVRDHDEPTKYVFNGSTRVARVTGSLSSNRRIQRLRLNPGWNLCSVAVDGAGLPASPEIDASYQWNALTQGWEPVAASDSLSANTILWIKASTNATLALTGVYNDPTNRPSFAGGSFIPGAGLEAWNILSTLDSQPSTAAWRFDSFSQTWLLRDPSIGLSDPDFPTFLAPGDAVFAHAGTPAEIETPDSTLRIRYYHQDHLGSSSVMTDAQGALVEETAFYPFGAARHEHRLREIDESYQFTQKERDRESGLHYFGKRFFHSGIGKWLSTDPMEEKGGSLNLYAYVNQNPIKYQDPDGGEITITPTIVGKGKQAKITHYEIHVKAVVVNLSPILKEKGYDRAKVEKFAADLKDTVEKSYTGKAGKITWKTTVDISVIDDLKQAKPGDHVFRLVDQTYDKTRGTSELGGKWMEIASSTFLATRPAKPGSVKDYLSPEGTGAHELGHTGRLPHWRKDSPNLMQEGSVREYDNTTITLDQIETMYSESAAGRLNEGSNQIGSWEASRKK